MPPFRDGPKQTAIAAKNGTTIGDDGKQLVERKPRNTKPRSHFSTAFPSVSPPIAFPFPSPTEATTMADAAEHDEELVDYDEEEVG